MNVLKAEIHHIDLRDNQFCFMDFKGNEYLIAEKEMVIRFLDYHKKQYELAKKYLENITTDAYIGC